MLASTFIDTAIGIAFVFLLLSLIASTVNEIFLSLLNTRGRELLKGLKTLLNDDDATSLVKSVYNHGQIYGLFQGEFDPKKPGNLPSYIPTSNFASALINVIREEHGQAVTVQQDEGAALQSIRQAAQQLTLKNEKVGKPIVAMIDAAEGDFSKFSKSVENWYNGAMDRVSGWYKYKTQKLLFGIGLVLAVSLNADTVRIVRELSQSDALRQSIVAAAQSAKAPDSSDPGTALQKQMSNLSADISGVEGLGIPLGWRGKGSMPGPFLDWLGMFGGWILTSIAVSLGAPFWFDLLNKFMVVRSTVKPREKSPEEPSKS
jgi:hypothetical protein